MTRAAFGAMLWTVLTWLRRVAVVVLAAGLSAGAWRPCAGWQATAEARMSCCMRNGACSMHRTSGDAAHAVHSQSDADACCAISDRQESQPPSFTVVLPPAFVPLAAVFPETPAVPARWVASNRPPPLLADRALPRHLLLSVFVI